MSLSLEAPQFDHQAKEQQSEFEMTTSLGGDYHIVQWLTKLTITRLCRKHLFPPTLPLHRYMANISVERIRDVAKKKNRENVGIFPKSGTPPPLPPVWEFFPDFTVYFWEVSHVKNSKKMEVGFG